MQGQQTPSSVPPISGLISSMDAINIAKVTTIIGLVLPVLVLHVNTPRVVLYLSLHVSYCVWWLLEQLLFPSRRKQLFTEQLGLVSLIAAILYVGIFYCLPGWLAMANKDPISTTATVVGLVLYIFGSLINATADTQKLEAKDRGADLVESGIWRRLRYVNYLGDLMRYSSFAVIAGSSWAWLLPISVLLLYVQRIGVRENIMAKKYSEFEVYRQNSWRLLPGVW